MNSDIHKALVISILCTTELKIVAELGTKEQIKDTVTKYIDMLESNFPELKKLTKVKINAIDAQNTKVKQKPEST